MTTNFLHTKFPEKALNQPPDTLWAENPAIATLCCIILPPRSVSRYLETQTNLIGPEDRIVNLG
jgi:hypothetical protein